MVRAAPVVGAVVLLMGVTGACTATHHTDASGRGHSGARGDTETGSGPYQPTGADDDAMQRLLDRRAAAVRHHDLAAFLTTVDRADVSFVRQQTTLFHNLERMPLASIRYVMDPSTGMSPAPVQGDDPTFRPPVVERVRIAGVDRAPVGNVVEDTFVRRPTGWLLGAESLAGHYLLTSEEAQSRPWGGGGAVAVARRGRLALVVDRSDLERAHSLAAGIAADIRKDAQVLGVAPEFDVLVDATSSGAAHRMSSLSQAKAYATTYPVFTLDRDLQRARIAGFRVKVNPNRVGTLMGDRTLLRHELTHFLTWRRMDRSPAWLFEGLANYVAFQPDVWSDSARHRDYARRAGRLPPDLPTTSTWGLHPVRDYVIAEAAVTALVRRYGIGRVLALGEAYARVPGDDADVKTGRVLRRVLGTSEARVLTETWRELRAAGS